MNLIQRILTALFFFLIGAACWANVYYVLPGGSDSNNGLSPATAFLTLTPVNFGGAHSLVAGDTLTGNGVINHTSDSLGSSLRLFNNVGTSGAPITISNYAGLPWIISNSGPNNSTIDIRNATWIKIIGLQSTNAYRTPDMQGCVNCELTGCSFGGQNANGALAIFSMILNCQSNWIHGNNFGPSAPFVISTSLDGGVHGVTVGTFYSTNDFSSYNIIENNNCFWSGHDVISCYGPSNVIRNNWCHSEARYVATNSTATPYTNVLWGSRDLELGGTIGNYNLVQGNSLDYAGFVPDYGCHGVEMSDGAYEIFRNNTCFSNCANAVAIYGGKVAGTVSVSNYVYNNTMVANGFNETFNYTNGSPTNIPFANYQSLFFSVSTSDNFYVNNLCWQNFNGLNTFLGGFSGRFDRNFTNNIDPLFKNPDFGQGPFVKVPPDLSLMFGSPAIGAGTNLAFVTSGPGTVTTFTVDNAGYFWGYAFTAAAASVSCDTIEFQGGQTSLITGISGNTITVATPVAVTTGMGVSLPYLGVNPSVGAYDMATLIMNGSSSAVLNLNGSGTNGVINLNGQ